LANITLAQGVVGSYAGSAPLAQAGRAILALPDVDGDGKADLALGSPFRETAAGFAAGAVEIRSGASGATILVLEGLQARAQFGAALATADVNGDGVVDLLVGSPLHSGTAGPAAGRIQ